MEEDVDGPALWIFDSFKIYLINGVGYLALGRLRKFVGELFP